MTKFLNLESDSKSFAESPGPFKLAVLSTVRVLLSLESLEQPRKKIKANKSPRDNFFIIVSFN